MFTMRMSTFTIACVIESKCLEVLNGGELGEESLQVSFYGTNSDHALTWQCQEYLGQQI